MYLKGSGLYFIATGCARASNTALAIIASHIIKGIIRALIVVVHADGKIMVKCAPLPILVKMNFFEIGT